MSIQVRVYDHDATYVKLVGDEQALDLIYDEMSFYADGYRFSPKFKEKLWDGKVRLMKYGNKIYRHLVPDIKELAEDRNWEFTDNTQARSGIFDEYNARAFCKALKPTSKGENIEFRDYQIKTVIKCLGNDCGTILSPTASGKSLSIYAVTRHALLFGPKDKKILIIVPTVQLVEQMYDDFCDYSTGNGFNVDENVHRIRAGKEKDADKPIYISTWQSLMRVENSNYFHKFHSVFVDEVHGAQAKCLTSIIQECINAYNRFGFTGTLKDSIANEMVITGLMGNIHKVITTGELIEQGYLADLDVSCVILKYRDELCKRVIQSKAKYIDEINFVTQYKRRNLFILKLAEATQGNTLVLFNFVKKQGDPLFELSQEVCKSKKIFYISGRIKVKDREEIRKYMESDTGIILLASYGTLSTGINIKNLDNIIFASPYKSKIKVLQSVGRVLRKVNDASKAKLFDIIDDMRYKRGKNHLYKQYLTRLEYYRDEKFPLKIIEHQLQ